ncbi:histidine--tRNA ligase [Candidatus Daviesbacteria bacterium]|nr:histidine--tRNA ligase [Candidatus Daviesbacteria bacterium]
MVNPKTLKGFRDFLPLQMRRRQYVINTLKKVFESFGFEPLETPALEYEEILLGKYGGEGDKLMYRFTDNGGRKVALRYDQTVPLARVVAQYGNQLPTPFKRYQIQPVWRAENTQKGRFREFLQCDIDTVGTSSLYTDAEILAIVYESFKKLNLDVKIKINDRSIFEGVNPIYLPTIDKLNKIGKEGVIKELKDKGELNPEEIFKKVSSMIPPENIVNIMRTFQEMGYSVNILKFDNTLVRGLNYYTGIIMEVVLASDLNSLSLGGGGRYDNLIGMFTGQDIPAVGFAFGFDRIMEAMDQLNLFPEGLTTAKVLVTVFSPDLLDKSTKLSSNLRSQNINTELWLDPNAKLEKQLKIADQKGIPYVVIIGPEEASSNKLTLKSLKTKEQQPLTLDEAIQKLRS